MTPAYRTPTLADADELAAVGTESFNATFAHLYPPADLAAFLPGGFGAAAFAAQLADPAIRFRVATLDGAIVGYAKTGPISLPVADPAGYELRQLYLLPRAHGAGIAQALMAWVLDTARGEGAAALYLSVFVDNHRAKSFYARYGFEEVGRYAYRVGGTIDDDRIWRLML